MGGEVSADGPCQPAHSFAWADDEIVELACCVDDGSAGILERLVLRR